MTTTQTCPATPASLSLTALVRTLDRIGSNFGTAGCDEAGHVEDLLRAAALAQPATGTAYLPEAFLRNW